MEFNPLEPATLSSEASEVIDFLVKYYQNIEKYPVRSKVEPNYLRNYIPESVPTLPESLENILKDIEKNIIPGLTHWQSPNFYAYFQATTSNAGLLGEILCTGFNVVGFTWISSPAATELEAIVMDWMGTLLQLPTYFLFSGGGGGVMLGSTSEAVMCTLSAARDRALNLHGEDKMTKLVVYASDHTHLCFQKSAKLVGIFPRNFRVLRTSSASDFALSSEELREAIDYDKSQGLIPIYICASVGTTSSNAVDPLYKIGKVAREYGVWLHVDAAYAGSACICPEYRHYLDGVEYADSFSMSPHKWLLTHLNSCCLWLKNPTTLVDSLSTKPEYLKNKVSELGQAIDYKDWQIAFGRRFESLKLWMVIRRYGSAKLMSHIRSDIELAKYFETLVNDDIRFELVVPRKFALVCFRLKPIGYYGDGNVMNQKLLEYVNSSGKAFMSHAVLGGVFTIRCAIGGSLTKKHNIDSLWTLIQEKVNAIMRNGANIA